MLLLSAEERKYECLIAHPLGELFKIYFLSGLLQKENSKTIKSGNAPEEPQLAGILPLIQLGTISN